MKINRKTLIKALDAVKPGLASREIIDQSTNFIFQDGRVFTFNDQIAVRHAIDLDLKGAVRAKEFHTLLNKTKQKEIELEVDKNQLLLHTKRSKAGIAMETEITIPIEEIGTPEDWTPLPKDFKAAMKLCYPAAGKDMSKPVLTNIFLNQDYALATDNDQISICRFDDVNFDNILLPADTIKILIRYSIIEYAITDNWLHFKTKDDSIFSCRMFEGEFPDMIPFLEIDGDSLKFPAETEEILERAGIFSEAKFNQDGLVLVTIKNNWMNIKAEGDYGWIEEKTRIRHKEPAISFHISPVILKSILRNSHSVIINDHFMKIDGESNSYIVVLQV